MIEEDDGVGFAFKFNLHLEGFEAVCLGMMSIVGVVAVSIFLLLCCSTQAAATNESCNTTVQQLTDVIETWEVLYGNCSSDLGSCRQNLEVADAADAEHNVTASNLKQCLVNWEVNIRSYREEKERAVNLSRQYLDQLDYERSRAFNETSQCIMEKNQKTVELERYAEACPNWAQVKTDFYGPYSILSEPDKECLLRLITMQHQSGSDSYFPFLNLPQICNMPADSRTGAYPASSYNVFFRFIADGWLQESMDGGEYRDDLKKTFYPWKAVNINLVCMRELDLYDKEIKQRVDDASASTFVWTAGFMIIVFLVIAVAYMIHGERRRKG